MNKSPLILFVVAVALLSCGSDPSGSTKIDSSGNPTDTLYDSISWQSLAVAFDTNVEKNDYSVIMFGDTSCAWCNLFTLETLSHSDVIQKLGEDFNTIWINSNADSLFNYRGIPVSATYLADSIYNASVLPSLNFLNKDGDFLIQFESFRDSLEMLEVLKYISSGNADTLAYQDTTITP